MSKQFWQTTVFALAMTMTLTNCGKIGESSTDQASFTSLTTDPIKPIDPDKPIITPVPKVQTAYQPILADRIYLTNLLKDIFGPTAMNVDTTRTDLKFQDHGSPCSFYVNHNVKNTAGNFVEHSLMERCSRVSPDLLTAPLNPKATVTRQALLTHACSDLVMNQTTFNVALSKIGTGIPVGSEANVLKAYRLFYRSQPDPHKGLLESLMVMIPATGATGNDWRVVLNAICTSGYWQAI